MARRRMVSTELTEDEKIETLIDKHGFFGESVWVRLIVCADDWGRLPGSLKVLAGRIYPVRREITPEQLEPVINTLCDLEMVLWYETDGKAVIALRNYSKYQTGLNINKKAKDGRSYESALPCITSESKPLHETTQKYIALPDITQPLHEKTPIEDNITKPKKNLSEGSGAVSAPLSHIKTFYDALGQLGDSNVSHAQEAASYLEDGMTEEVVFEAIKRARNKRGNWALAKGILSSWLQKGIKTLPEVIKDDEEFRDRKAGKEPQTQSKVTTPGVNETDAEMDRLRSEWGVDSCG